MVEMIPLYKPYMPQLPELDTILHSGNLAYGEYSRHFEKKLTDFLGIPKNVFAVNSFNMAILVTISLLNMKFDDEVIAAPMGWLSSTQPFVTQGINVKWADIDPKTGTLDPESVRKRISKKTKAIVHNHFCGYPGYIDEINEIGKEYGIPIIDDGIEAFGSSYKGQRIGSCGTDITVFSFNAVRFPNTIDGGAIIIRDSELNKKAEMIRDCGIDRSIFRDEIGEISPLCDVALAGHSATMSNVNAYIGIEQMKYVEKILDKQRRQAEKWQQELQRNEKHIVAIGRSDIEPNYWVFGVLAQNRNKREIILEYRRKGWYASGVHLNNNVYSVFGKQDKLPGVEEFYSKFVALPCGWWIDNADVRE